jgi:hypothetical protein
MGATTSRGGRSVVQFENPEREMGELAILERGLGAGAFASDKGGARVAFDKFAAPLATANVEITTEQVVRGSMTDIAQTPRMLPTEVPMDVASAVRRARHLWRGKRDKTAGTLATDQDVSGHIVLDFATRTREELLNEAAARRGPAGRSTLTLSLSKADRASDDRDVGRSTGCGAFSHREFSTPACFSARGNMSTHKSVANLVKAPKVSEAAAKFLEQRKEKREERLEAKELRAARTLGKQDTPKGRNSCREDILSTDVEEAREGPGRRCQTTVANARQMGAGMLTNRAGPADLDA